MWVTNIQRMCFHDGPGIRTTVFLKGCSIHCPWCSNPENIDFKSPYGRKYDAGELANELLKDEHFWKESGGGVTFSGGEPFLQIDEICEVTNIIDRNKTSVILESALFVDLSLIKKCIDCVDGVIVDIKILNKKKCKDVLGGTIDDYKANVEFLAKRNKIIMFRIPCCPEYTLTEDNTHDIAKFLSDYTDIPVEIFSVHRIAESKYKHLGKSMPKYNVANREQLNRVFDDLALVSKNIKIVNL